MLVLAEKLINLYIRRLIRLKFRLVTLNPSAMILHTAERLRRVYDLKSSNKSVSYF